MKNSKAYKTGLSVSFIDGDEPKPPYKGKNWLSQIEKVKRKTHSSDEIIIHSKTQEAAQRALNLILGCLNLCTREAIISPGDFNLLAHRDEEIENLPSHEKARFPEILELGMFQLLVRLQQRHPSDEKIFTLYPNTILA